MRVPLSWLKDFIDLDGLSLIDLARALTMVGLEVDEIDVIGLPLPVDETQEFKVTGLAWDPEKFVVAQIDEVMPHPNADRLTLCKLNDGREDLVVLTGAPNLFEYKGIGPLAQPIKVAYAREGARLYDGHQPGQVLTTLKRTKIRGVESFSMVCSEKELGISEEHEGIIIFDSDAPTGVPLADYIGDAVYEVSILPNMIRDACVLGVARELSAALNRPLRKPDADYPTGAESIQGKVGLRITAPELNPRFVLGLIRDTQPSTSPYAIQRRLRLAGMRPINSIVDATNYVMLEIGQPLHAFDYDKLVERAGGKTPTILTRAAGQGEKITTLDGVEHTMDSFSAMVCDEAGSLSIAGVMGGAETEVTESTRNVLLEGAAWNFINVRKTVSAQRANSEAAYRFARGVHPELAPWGVQLGMKRILEWGGGEALAGLIDEYPLPPQDPTVAVTEADVARLLGIELKAAEVAALLERIEFTCRVEGTTVYATAPAHRLDIGEGVIGRADVLEEVARLYGYDRIPSQRLASALPEQRRNPSLEAEIRVQDVLVALGLQEIITYRLTSPEREARIHPAGQAPAQDYVRLLNPSTPERTVMRRSLLASALEIVERNARTAERLAIFEVGPVFEPVAGQSLPAEPRRLSIAITGTRHAVAWDTSDTPNMDFYDLKGMLEGLAEEMHLQDVSYAPAQHPSFHPGKCAAIKAGEVTLGVFGELHPQVKANYEFGPAPVLAAELDLEALIAAIPARFIIQPVPVFPPVYEDLAVVVDEGTPAAQVEAVIRQGGGKLVSQVRLFDIFRSAQVGEGKKSLAYALAYQAPDRTLTDKEAAGVRQRIIRRLEQELGAKLRS